VTQLANLGKYHILERLAADEIAEIYKVKTIGIAGFEKVQVLKRIQPSCARDPKFVREFIDQAKIAFSLNHRNIVQVFEFGKIDGDLFLAMEYIPGANLHEIMLQALRQQKIPPVGLTCYLMGEVAAGLEYAHRKADHYGQELRIVHCDVNPRNIACSFEGSVKLLDFGISRAVWNMISYKERQGWVPRHLSPEQVRGVPLDARSDIFSFGVILWEMLTGSPLFPGRDVNQVTQDILHQQISSPRASNPDVPPHLDDLTMHCLDRDLSKRIESASDLQMELHRIQRMLGAVIGSRALSTYIEDLLAGYNDTRDVRQAGVEEPVFEEPIVAVPSRSNDLVDAAAELAAPLNPPADPVFESTVEPRYHHTPLHAFEDDLLDDPADDPLLRRPSQEAQLAGVLRSGRHPDEEVTDTPGSHRRARRRTGISTISSDEITAGPVPVDPELTPHLWADEPDDEDDQLSTVNRRAAPMVAEEISLADALEIASADASTFETARRQEQVDDVAEQPPPEAVFEPALEAPPELAPEESRAPPAPVASKAHPAPTLGEKKRFFAVSFVLEGEPTFIDEAARLVSDIAFKLDGILHQQDHDQLLVLFGLPAADENDVVTAARFAFDAREAVAQWDLPVGGDLAAASPTAAVRVGIRTGTARMGGSPSKEGYQLLGNAISEVEGLGRHAQPGQILIAGLAARLAAAHYVLRDVKPLRRHGKLVNCYRMLTPRSRSSRRRAPTTASLVGREVETNAIRTAWRESVLQGVQRAALIAGEAGVGKSRLIDEFLSRHTADALVIAAAATPHRRGAPYSVIVDLVRAVAESHSTHRSRSWSRLFEVIRTLLSDQDPQLLEPLEALVVPNRAQRDSSGFSRLGIHRALRRLLQRVAREKPLVVVVEDLHWSDSASLKCLTTLVDRAEKSSGALFFLMTVRPEEGLDPRQVFASDAVYFQLLEELDEADRRTLVEDLLGKGVSEKTIKAVERRAGGNPFYIHELAHAIKELDPAGTSDVPANVQGVIAGRVDRLPGPVKSLLQHAAVVGPSFREAILAKLIQRNPARPLGILRNRGFIVPGLRVASPSPEASGVSEQFEREWAFRHVLIQEVVYDAISGVARRDLHRRVSEIMVRRVSRGSNDPLADVARHLELGGETRQAGEYFLRAANEAASAFASREALGLYNRALKLSEGDAERLYQAHAGRERVCAQLGLHGEQAADLEALRPLSSGDPRRRADLLNREALHLLRLGEFYRALSAAEQAEAAATEAGDELVRGEALLRRGEVYSRLDDHARAVEAVSKALQIFEAQSAEPSQIRARIGLGRINLIQANYDQAFDQYIPALELIQSTGDRWQERLLRNSLAVVHLCRGDFAKALDEALYSYKLCDQFGDRAREGDNATVIGIVHLELGLYEQARRYIEGALAIHQETGSQWSEADTLVYLGNLETLCNRSQLALRCYERAKVIAKRIGARYITINARNATAWSLCERGTTNDAARAVDEATEAAETARSARLIVGEIPGLSRTARATALLGNLDAARGLSRRAVELLEEQRHIESSEEEIYYTHFRILELLDDPSAAEYLERAHAGFTSKVERLDRPEWRESFTQRVRLNAAIIKSRGMATDVS
jgi:predicted ATPase/serine/threonine protein kinase